MVDHVRVDDCVDDELAQLAPARRVHRSEHIRLGAAGQQAVHGGEVAVLQHARVVVHQRQLVPHIHEVCIVHTCRMQRTCLVQT